MGQRAIVYCFDREGSGTQKKGLGTVSSGVYLHWSGHRVLELARELFTVMKGETVREGQKYPDGDRSNDASYAAARLAAIACDYNPGNVSVGLLNSDTIIETIVQNLLDMRDFTKGQLKHLEQQWLDDGTFFIDTLDWVLYQVKDGIVTVRSCNPDHTVERAMARAVTSLEGK